MLSLLYKSTICIAFLLCLSWYGQTHFYRDPGSVFFDKTRAYEASYSAIRKAEAAMTIESLTNEASTQPDNASSVNKTLCLALNSVSRQTQYLPITIGSILNGLSGQERQDLNIYILIAETDPTRHPNWNEEWLKRAAENVYTYDDNTTMIRYLSELEKKHNYPEKGVIDYTLALEQCYGTDALYVGVFEDDILLARGWFMRTLQGLADIMTIDPEQNWLFMRLFNQERSTGWASHEIGGNHEFWIILGIGIGISAPALFARRRWRAAQKYLDREILFAVVFILVPGLVILVYQSGKASLFPPSPGVVTEPFGCCSQAMIFPRRQIPLLISELRRRKRGQIDLMLDDIAIGNGLDRYALYPVQAQHIGIDSARKTTKDEAQAVWSMAFENLDSEVLERENERMISRYQSLREKIYEG
ncbi:integral membrane [Fusarium longipes]|uniref:Integral membrane n=1 Tax=Fusarium longipes TaxID=694270 RepID=A0A395SJH6_9HYPO|nr:integral membrane [Fusarium longipes]